MEKKPKLEEKLEINDSSSEADNPGCAVCGVDVPFGQMYCSPACQKADYEET